MGNLEMFTVLGLTLSFGIANYTLTRISVEWAQLRDGDLDLCISTDKYPYSRALAGQQEMLLAS